MLSLFSPSLSFFISIIFFVLGAIGALFFSRNDKFSNIWASTAAVIGSIFALIASGQAIFYGTTFSITAPSTLPLLSFSIVVDKLSAFFIFIIALIALFASIYAFGYVRHFFKRYNIGTLGFFYNIFIAAMLLVVAASNVVFFLVAWEIMSLASYFLVIYEHKEPENIKAGSLYFIMTHVGTAFIILAFLLLYSATGSLDFVTMQAHGGALLPWMKNAVFLLMLVGFGTKAGIIPLHIWLPAAHPAAPTHVSALMSGVMIKTGIYMFIRIFVGMMSGGIPLWWGGVILVIGAISSLLGVLYALTEHDIKRLLAYHSIENIGIILLGLGSALMFLSANLPSLAVLGLVASLFHTLNHAVFKSLLFLGSGSVISQVHTRNMEELGGLITYMPYTAVFFLVGSMAISALPPFNGFFSEWVTFQSLFGGIFALGIAGKWLFILAASALAFTGGLAAACFVKAFGVTFLARPRSEEVRHAKESSSSLLVGMGALAVLCLFIGIFAGPISTVLADVVATLPHLAGQAPFHSTNAGGFSLASGFTAISLPLIFGYLVLLIALVFVIVYWYTKKNKVIVARTWDCGVDLTPRMEITATGFSRSIIVIFQRILRPTQHIEGDSITYETKDIYRIYFYRPLELLVTKISELVKKIQSGSVNSYILYTFLVLVILLVFLES